MAQSKGIDKILLVTDLSENSAPAASYAYHLAVALKTNLLLCNAIVIPVEIPQAGVSVWPMEESAFLVQDSSTELKELQHKLENLGSSSDFKPPITFYMQSGTLVDVVNDIIPGEKVDLVVMGSSNSGELSHFLLENHSKNMINRIMKPLLIVPLLAIYGSVNNIAFASDYQDPEHDKTCLHFLVQIARKLNAKIVLTHIRSKDTENPRSEKWVRDFMIQASVSTAYAHMFYQFVENSSIKDGLGLLCEKGEFQLLTMVHRRHSFFEELFHKSYTQHVASRLKIPLLVFQS